DIDAYCAEVLHITPAQQEALRLAYLG
ncbi:MAG: hypothetical protein RJB22_1088, partial [Pseudomonadota bacterium]